MWIEFTSGYCGYSNMCKSSQTQFTGLSNLTRFCDYLLTYVNVCGKIEVTLVEFKRQTCALNFRAVNIYL